MIRTGLLVAMIATVASVAAAAAPLNMAKGKAYRYSPAPGYHLCTDPGDRTQLTDGVYTKGYFWTQSSTVGWQNVVTATVTIDLGRVEPIGGVSMNMAAGRAGVAWPAEILVMVSDDGKTYRFLGDLMRLSAAEHGGPPAGYGVHRFRTGRLATRGRWVRLVVITSGPFTFCDEIEVHRGADELLLRRPGGRAVGDVTAHVRRVMVTRGVRRRIRADAAAVREALRSAELSAAARKRLDAELADVRRQAEALTVEVRPGFRTVLPLNALHRRVFSAQAELWRAGRRGDLVVWQKNRWDMLSPTEPPRAGGARIDVAMMRNEHRGAAVNVTNVSAEPIRLKLSFTGLPGGATPGWIDVLDVPFTDTKSGVPVAAAMPAATRVDGGYEVEIPSGLTRQVWLTFRSKDMAAGGYDGALRIDPPGRRVPIRVTVHPVTFPAATTLHLCGWDYTDADAYEVTPANRAAVIRTLREHHVNTPWAQRSAMPTGRYDKAGRMTSLPDDARLKTWLARWPGAKMYLVFAAVGNRFASLPIGTPAFARAVTAWARWWSARAKALGIPARRLGVLLVDEPHSVEQDRTIVEYAKMIRAAAPDIVVWEDPTWREPWKATEELFTLSDVLCPNLPMWIAGGKRFGEFYAKQRQGGRELWLYSCSGPGKLLDPYAYHRMQHWFCWKFGATGSGFWAFGDSNRASSWNEYLSVRGAYTPLFLDERTVTRGKHMEAIREGVQDYEYLRMLRDRIAAAAKADPSDPRLAGARRLLAAAADRVTACMTDVGQINWPRDKDRSIADRVRVEVLEMLSKLAAPR